MKTINCEVDEQGVRVDRCERCVHFMAVDENRGQCRRYPPTLLTFADMAMFVDVGRNAWCGEFQKHPLFL